MFTEAILDRRFVALPRLIRDATNPNPAAGDLRRFMETLLEADGDLFTGVLLFRAPRGNGFVLVDVLKDAGSSPRGWLRWPLRRLFRARRACVITNPADGQRALATPFCAGEQFFVVVALLRDDPPDAAQTVLLAALQSIGNVSVEPETAADTLPRFVWFGEDPDLAERLRDLASRRGWEFSIALTFGHVLTLLQRDAVDIALLEGATMANRRASLRALRHAARVPDAPLIYFTNQAPDFEIETLVDAIVAPLADERDLLRVLKRTVSSIGRVRKIALRRDVQNLEYDLCSCSGYTELARRSARAAGLIGCSVVSVMLVDDAGRVHTAKRPFDADHVLARLPIAFVTGETLMRTAVDADFFKDVFDDPEQVEEVRRAAPVSGVSIPIRDGTHIRGTLIALSTGRPMFEAEFSALSDLTELAGRALSELRTCGKRDEIDAPNARAWWRVAAGDVRVDVFEGMKAQALFRVAAYDDGTVAAIVCVEDANREAAAQTAEAAIGELLSRADDSGEGSLATILKRFEGAVSGLLLGITGADNGLSYACARFPVPLQIGPTGPVSSLRYGYPYSVGSISAQPGSLTLIPSSAFVHEIDTAQLVKTVQHTLQGGGPNPMGSVPELTEKMQALAFASVTMQSSVVCAPPRVL